MKKLPPPKYRRKPEDRQSPSSQAKVRSLKPPVDVDMSNAVAKICAEVGVEICKTNENRGVAGRTAARATLERIYRDHGEGHLILVLRTITETENANIRMDAFVLHAISDLIVAHPEWANTGLRWLEVFDKIDLSDLQTQAKFNRNAVSQRGRHRNNAVSGTV